MTIQEKINSDMKKAMLNKNVEVRDLLRVVIGEFNREDKILSDSKVISIIKKMVTNAKDQNNIDEVNILEKYLPLQLDENQLRLKINEIIIENKFNLKKDMGSVMKFIKEKYSGQYDGKLASKLTNDLLI